MTTSHPATRDERDAARRAAYDQRMAYLATKRGRAAAARAADKAREQHLDRLAAYIYSRRGAGAHLHIPGSRVRAAKKADQRARRAQRERVHAGDPRTWRQRRKAAA